MKKRRNISFPIGTILFLFAVVLYAFTQYGFRSGVQLLGEIVNIFGTVIVLFFNLFFSIPHVTEEIVKRVLTTLLILCLSAWWCWSDFGAKTKNNIINIIAKIGASLILTVLSWVGIL